MKYGQKIEKAKPASIGTVRARPCAHIHGCRRFPARGANADRGRDAGKILRCELAARLVRRVIARRSPDDRLQARRDPHSRTAARRQAAMKARFLRGTPAQAADTAELMPRYKLTIDMTARRSPVAD